MNDTNFIMFIMLLFIGLGVLLPFINQGLGGEGYDSNNLNVDTDELENFDVSNVGIGSLDILGSVLKMFFWTFGSLPFLIDSFFVILRVMLIILLYRQVRSGSG